MPFDQLLASLADADASRNLSALTRLRVVHSADASTAVSDQGSASEMTLIVTQNPTAHRLMPLDLNIVYNTVLFSDLRIDELLSQLSFILTQLVLLF